MVHGQKDEVVPIKYSREVLKIFSKAKKKLNIIKKGDHSLSSKKNLNIICKELDNIIKNRKIKLKKSLSIPKPKNCTCTKKSCTPITKYKGR